MWEIHCCTMEAWKICLAHFHLGMLAWTYPRMARICLMNQVLVHPSSHPPCHPVLVVEAEECCHQHMWEIHCCTMEAWKICLAHFHLGMLAWTYPRMARICLMHQVPVHPLSHPPYHPVPVVEAEIVRICLMHQVAVPRCCLFHLVAECPLLHRCQHSHSRSQAPQQLCLPSTAQRQRVWSL